MTIPRTVRTSQISDLKMQKVDMFIMFPFEKKYQMFSVFVICVNSGSHGRGSTQRPENFPPRLPWSNFCKCVVCVVHASTFLSHLKSLATKLEVYATKQQKVSLAEVSSSTLL